MDARVVISVLSLLLVIPLPSQADPPFKGKGWLPPGLAKKFGKEQDDGSDGVKGPPGLSGHLPPGWSRKLNNNDGWNESTPCASKSRDDDFDETGWSKRDDDADKTPKPRASGCVLPKQPKGGSYKLGGCSSGCSLKAGDTVPSYSILYYSCHGNYVLNGNTISVCIDDRWHQPPTCRKTCSPLNSTTVDVFCIYQDDIVSCKEPMMPGTKATLACKESYKLPLTNDPAYREIVCQDDAEWDRPLFRCVPGCGSATSRGNVLVAHGFSAKIGSFPWNAGIYTRRSSESYEEHEQICGGTLISSNLVISAAHCFYDEIYSRLQDASNYAVAVGKYYRDWNAKEVYAQTSNVKKIEIPDRYLGAKGNFAEDIAVLTLSNPFELTALVLPVCIDWDNIYEKQQLQIGSIGRVVGYGKTEDGEYSKTLQEINLPYVDYDHCLDEVPPEFRGYITPDKFCAGYTNGSSLSEGDSGEGLCFPMREIWYLRGIVSVSPVRKSKHDKSSYIGLTCVSFFRNWIRSIYLRN